MNPAPGPAGAQSVRRHNLALVLGVLAREGPRSRAALAATTGLTKASVSSLVDELALRRLVRPAASASPAVPPDAPPGAPPGAPAARAGRPGLLVETADTVVGLGAAIEVDGLAACAVDVRGEEVGVKRIAVDNAARPAPETLAELRRLVTDLRRSLAREGRRGIGLTVAVPGLVRDGTVAVAPNLGWLDVDVATAFSRGHRAAAVAADAVAVDNEANLAALAELRSGDAPGPSFVAVSGGVGVGAGVILDGRVWRGAHGFGGELGHFAVAPDGETCRCGNRGCLETIAGKAALARRARRGEPLEPVGAALAAALAPVVSLLDPDGVVLTGALAPLAPVLAPVIERALADRVLGGRFTTYPVTASTLGERAPARGAALASVQHVLDDPSVAAA